MLIEAAAGRNVNTDAPKVYNIPANTAVLVLHNEQGVVGEISLRLIQNVGANACFYSENLQNNNGDINNPTPTPICDGTSQYNGVLQAGQQLDCTSHRQCVCVFSTGGTTISTTIRRRPIY